MSSIPEARGCCTPQSPWTSRLVGPAVLGPQEGLANFVVSPVVGDETEFPCGAMIEGTWHNTAPPVTVGLQPFAEWSGCVGDPSKPGALVLVRGHVRALQQNGIVRPSMGGCMPGVRSRVAQLKLGITACGMPGPVFIDLDSELVIPAGPCTIQVFGTPLWSQNAPKQDSVEDVNLWVDLAVTACPCDCGYHPQGRLTWYMQQDFANTPDDGATLVVPRRARRVNATGLRGATVATPILTWVDDGGSNFGGWQQNFWDFYVPSFPYLRVSPATTNGLTQTVVIWGIE